MKTLEQLKDFCQGFVDGYVSAEGTTFDCDDWVIWDKFDINFTGNSYAEGIGDSDLHVSVYPKDWEELPSPLFDFVVKGKP